MNNPSNKAENAQAPQAEDTSSLVFSIKKLIRMWAMLGGIVLLAVVVLNGLSVAGSIFGRPFPGDFELTEVGIAIAAFAFLPYCQLTAANVSADIFTAKASGKTVSLLNMLGSIVALSFSLLLLWRMSLGMMDQLNYGYTTSILSFPHWIAFIPILMSLALLAVASLITAHANFSSIKRVHPFD